MKGNQNLLEYLSLNIDYVHSPDSIPDFKSYEKFYAYNSSTFPTLLFSETEESTQTFCKQLIKAVKHPFNVVYLTHNQTAGKGRLKNKWEASTDTVCFSYTYNMHLDPNFDMVHACKVLSYLPYLNCLCVVEALGKQGLKEQVKIKWPNDVYALSEGTFKKMAGILCESEKMHYENDETLVAVCGVGINFDSSPSGDFTSVKDVHGEVLDRGEFLKNFFEEIDSNIIGLRSVDGRNKIATKITKNWLHTNQVVDVCCPELGDFKAKIVGISDSGFLEVESDTKLYEVSLFSYQSIWCGLLRLVNGVISKL